MSKDNKEVRERLSAEIQKAVAVLNAYGQCKKADSLEKAYAEFSQPSSEGTGEVGLRWVSEIVIREFLRNDERIIRTEMQDECCKLIQRFLKKFGENKPQAGKAQQLKQEILKRFGKYLRVEPLDFTPNLSAQMDLYAKAYLEEYTLPLNTNVEEAVEILKELCQLKHHKDNVGKDQFYEKRQPELWQKANNFLNSLVKHHDTK